MDSAVMDSGAKRARIAWSVAFVGGMGLAGGIINSVHLGYFGSLAVALVPMLMLFPLVRATERAQAAAGCTTPAMRRYTRRAMVMSFGYVLTLFAALGTTRHITIEGPLLWAFALLPTVPIIGLIWAIARLLIEETDEFQRMRMVRASLIASGLVLVAATLWGFLEMFGLVPHVWLWAVFPLWALGLGVGQIVNRRVFGEPGC